MKPDVDGPFGIRFSVWLAATLLLLGCAFVMVASRPRFETVAAEPIAEETGGENLFPPPQPMVSASVHHNPHSDIYEADDNDDAQGQFLTVEQMVADRRTWMDDPQ